jgi:hypothetical protein
MENIKAYILSIFATALLITVADILAPSSGGATKHLKLVSSLVFICVLISPTVSLAQKLQDFANGNWEFELEEDVEDHYSSELQNALDDASFAYFEGMLKQTLCQEFAIAEDDLRVRVEWAGTGTEMRPHKVTVILSGKAIWKDPAKIEGYVTSLLDCDCVSAIE